MATKFLAYLSLAVACAAQVSAIAATPPAPPPAPDESFSAGKQLGQTQLSGTVTGIKNATSTSVVPNYNTNPPQKAIYNSGSTTDAAQTARANCQAHPDDPTCAGYLQATQSRPPSDVTAADPALAGAGAAADPTTILGNISSTYSSCTSGTPSLVTPAQFERDSCSVNTNSWTTNTCDKTLTVYPSDTNSCTQGTYYGSNSAQFADSADVAFQKVFCDMTRNDGQIVFRIGVGSVTQDVPVAVATPIPAAGGLPLIVANLTLPEEDWTDYNASRQTFPTVAVYLVNHGCAADGSCTVDFFFFMAQTGYYKACNDCLPPDYFSVPAAYFTPDGAGGYTIVAGGPQAHTTLTFLKPGLAHKAGDYWSSTCAPYEKLTSVLPQDGINPSPPLAVPVLNQLNAQQCSRTHSVCTDGPSTKIINGVPETRACWHWADTFDCTTLNATSTCTDPRFRSCSQAGAPTCTLDDGHGHCLDSQAQFDCKTADAVYSPSVNCGGASDFCAGGSCYPTTYQKDKDFALSVSMLEAQREAGRYYDPANLRIFPGTESQCKDELFGLNDCCATGHTSAWDAFKNSAVGGASVSQIGKMALSSFTYDGLFTDLKPDWSLKGFEKMLGTAFDGPLRALKAGDTLVKDFIGHMVPNPWNQAMLALQMTGLANCSADNKNTAIKKDAKLCHEVGEYCSRRIPLIGCQTMTHTFCCYPSRLTRIINEQGQPQLSHGWGDAHNPVCNGFTTAELAQLDFSRMDLSEFYAEIQPTSADVSALQSQTNNKQIACFYGAGNCGH
jgi:conjugal transfer mating pair stabilization protein TraN